MNMNKILEKNNIKVERENGCWCKLVTGVDPSQRGGYSILGEFVDVAKDEDLQEGLYIDCDKKHDYKKNVFRLFKLEGDEVELLSEIVGNNWTTEFHKIIKEKLGKTVEEGLVEIWNIIKQYDVDEQIEIRRRLYGDLTVFSEMFKEMDVSEQFKSFEEEAGEKITPRIVSDCVAEAVWRKIDRTYITADKYTTEKLELGRLDNDELEDYEYHIFTRWGEYLVGVDTTGGKVVIRVAELEWHKMNEFRL